MITSIHSIRKSRKQRIKESDTQKQRDTEDSTVQRSRLQSERNQVNKQKSMKKSQRKGAQGV